MDYTEYNCGRRCPEAGVSSPPPFTRHSTNNVCSFVSRQNPKSNDKHVVLGVFGYDPRKFAEQMNLNLNNGWGIVRTVVDIVRSTTGATHRKYVLVKDPNKPLLRLYEVPLNTFEEGDDEVDEPVQEEEGEE